MECFHVLYDSFVFKAYIDVFLRFSTRETAPLAAIKVKDSGPSKIYGCGLCASLFVSGYSLPNSS